MSVPNSARNSKGHLGLLLQYIHCFTARFPHPVVRLNESEHKHLKRLSIMDTCTFLLKVSRCISSGLILGVCACALSLRWRAVCLSAPPAGGFCLKSLGFCGLLRYSGLLMGIRATYARRNVDGRARERTAGLITRSFPPGPDSRRRVRPNPPSLAHTRHKRSMMHIRSLARSLAERKICVVACLEIFR
jgi:hypothetical protein